jgi:hypothetical protein
MKTKQVTIEMEDGSKIIFGEDSEFLVIYEGSGGEFGLTVHADPRAGLFLISDRAGKISSF